MRLCLLLSNPLCSSDWRGAWGGQGGEAAMHGHPFVMTAEGGPDTGENITTVADVVLTGCPAFADGNSWIGETHRTPSGWQTLVGQQACTVPLPVTRTPVKTSCLGLTLAWLIGLHLIPRGRASRAAGRAGPAAIPRLVLRHGLSRLRADLLRQHTLGQRPRCAGGRGRQRAVRWQRAGRLR